MSGRRRDTGLAVLAAALGLAAVTAQTTESSGVDPFTAAWLVEVLERDASRSEAAYAAAFADADATLPQRLLAAARQVDRARARGEEQRAEQLAADLRRLIEAPRDDDRRGRGRPRGRGRDEPDLPRAALTEALASGDAARIASARAALLEALRRSDDDAPLHRVTTILLRQIDEQRGDAIAAIYAELATAREAGDTARIAELRHQLAREFGGGRFMATARSESRELRRGYVELLLEGGEAAVRSLRARLDRRQRMLLRADRRDDDLDAALREFDQRAADPTTDRTERDLLRRTAARLRAIRDGGDDEAARRLLRMVPRTPW